MAYTTPQSKGIGRIREGNTTKCYKKNHVLLLSEGLKLKRGAFFITLLIFSKDTIFY